MSVDVRSHTVKLGNRDYIQVSGRILIAHEANPDHLFIETDVTYEDEEKIRVKASVRTEKGTYTGHAESYKRTGGPQEKKTPLEVAETSAIGRALGFAGYAIEGGIASADEVSNSVSREDSQSKSFVPAPQKPRNPPPPTPTLADLRASIDALKERHWTADRIKAEYLKVIPDDTPSAELEPQQLAKVVKHFDGLVRAPVGA